jgi:transcriptional regulator with XRE-family HTH domain
LRPTTFGALVRYLRIERGMLLADLAKEAGISPGYISRIENGQRYPTRAETVKRIALSLDTDADELFLLANQVPPDVMTIISSNPKGYCDMIRAMGGSIENARTQ